MKPLLAHIYESHRVTYPCYVQPKLNGIRALYQGGHFQSRDEIPFPDGLLRHLVEPLQKTFGPEVILDGELYVHGWPLQRINAAVTPVRQTPTEDTVKVEYHVFDTVNFTKPFFTRMRESDIEPFTCLYPGFIKCVETKLVNNAKEADELYARFVSQGYEGMMYRLGDCPYTVPKQLTIDNDERFWKGGNGPAFNSRSRFLSDKSNRCWHLLKRKDWQDDEFECLSVVEGEGKLQGTLGALTCASHATRLGEGRHSVFSVGSGLTDAERDHYWANPPIGKLIKVKYLVLSEAGIPLNPTILCIL